MVRLLLKVVFALKHRHSDILGGELASELDFEGLRAVVAMSGNLDPGDYFHLLELLLFRVELNDFFRQRGYRTRQVRLMDCRGKFA